MSSCCNFNLLVIVVGLIYVLQPCQAVQLHAHTCAHVHVNFSSAVAEAVPSFNNSRLNELYVNPSGGRAGDALDQLLVALRLSDTSESFDAILNSTARYSLHSLLDDEHTAFKLEETVWPLRQRPGGSSFYVQTVNNGSVSTCQVTDFFNATYQISCVNSGNSGVLHIMLSHVAFGAFVPLSGGLTELLEMEAHIEVLKTRHGLEAEQMRKALQSEWLHMALPCGNDTSNVPRVVINSHSHYFRAVDQLLHSMASVGYADFCRVVVVVGGAISDTPPHRVGSLTFINSTLNAHDYTGLAMLYQYRTHPLVDAPGFMYLLDTSLASPQFPVYIRETLAPAVSAAENTTSLFVQPGMTSNIIAFGRGFIDVVGNRFLVNLTKMAALQMELNGVLLNLDKNIVKLCSLKERTAEGDFDIYGTGYKRAMFYYDVFGVHKFILWDHHGDFDGVLLTQDKEAAER